MIEELQAIVLAVADDDVAVIVDRNPVRQMKLARPGPDLAP